LEALAIVRKLFETTIRDEKPERVKAAHTEIRNLRSPPSTLLVRL
jgi:hypothetical protein